MILKNRPHIVNSKRLNTNLTSYFILEYMHHTELPLYIGSKVKRNKGIYYIGIDIGTLTLNINLLVKKGLLKKTNKEEFSLTSKSKKHLDKWLGNVELFEDSFSKFWDLYPSKIGKKTAHDSFLKIPFDTDNSLLDKLLSGIQNRIKYEKELDDKEFIPQWPHPSTYLNNRRWEDVFELKKQNKSKSLVYKKTTKEIL